MTDYANEHLSAAKRLHGTGPRARLVCADGYSLSIQAGDYWYSTPRTPTGPYTHVEVGYPANADEKEIIPRSFGSGRRDGMVWGWVPVEVVNRWIRRHGGPKT